MNECFNGLVISGGSLLFFCCSLLFLVTADLTSVWHWNTHQINVFLVAEYTTDDEVRGTHHPTTSRSY